MTCWIGLFLYCDMCTSPKKILNRSAHFDPSQPTYLVVPCGECEECRNTKRNEWFVRCYYEWKLNKCWTYFYTLTFNNENLPYSMGVPCFSKRLIQLFLKRFRKTLAKLGVHVRYLISSEFGEKYKRPHHHALFFFDSYVAPYQLYKLIQESWQYGFVKYGDNFGLVNSSAGIRYVTKYVTKDMANIDSYFPILASRVYERYTVLLDWLRSRYSLTLPASLHLDYETHKLYIRDWKNLDDIERLELDKNRDLALKICNKAKSVLYARLPFHLQSTRLGLAKCESLLHDELIRGFVHITTFHGVKKFALPRCYKRAFWYDRIENELDGKRNKFVLNEVGKRAYIERLQLSQSSLISRYQSLCLNTHLLDNDIYVRACSVMSFDSKEELCHLLANCDINFETLAIYQSVFRGRICPFKFADIPLNESIVRDNWLDYADYCTYAIVTLDYGKIYDKFNGKDKLETFNLLLWDAHPFFMLYEKYLQLFEVLDNSLRECVSEAQRENEKNSRSLRELVNNNYLLFN